jgi:hypothetical protein
MTKTYRVVLASNQGSFAAAALASSAGGEFRDTVERFDGTHDLAYIDVPDDSADYLESMLDEDPNVVSYGDVS